jgi:serine/threonine protein phosphatase PrpC
MSAVPEAPAFTLTWSAQTDRGRVRQNNEDSFLALTFDGREVRYLGKTGQSSLAGSDFVFAVSDGMGGAKSGEFASRITVERITRLLPASFKLAAHGLDRGFNDVLEELFTSIHREMIKLGSSYDELSGMGATLSLAWFTPGWCYFGDLGDSRIYHLPAAGGIKQVTHDHTYVGWLRREGKLNEREARTHPGKNSLNQALGAQHQFVEPQIGAIGCQAGDRFLICSDGLVDGLWDANLEDLIRQAPAGPDSLSVAQRLVREAGELSGRDNATAVVIEVGAPASA